MEAVQDKATSDLDNVTKRLATTQAELGALKAKGQVQGQGQGQGSSQGQGSGSCPCLSALSGRLDEFSAFRLGSIYTYKTRILWVHVSRSHQKSKYHEIVTLCLIRTNLNHDEARI